MEISPIRLFYLLLASFVFGGLVGGLYDIHRIIRVLFGVQYTKNRPTKLFLRPLPILKRPLTEISQGNVKASVLSVVIFIQDVILFCVASLGIVILNYTFNDGQLRFYTIFVLLLGFLVYYFTIGKLVIFLSEWIVFFIRAIFSIFFCLLSRPFVLIFVFFGKNFKKVGLNIKKALANRRKKVYNITKVKKCFQNADQGFL